MSAQLTGPLFLGRRVQTDLGPGEVVDIRNAHDVVRHGKPLRGTAYATILLDRGGRRICPRRELRDLPP